MVDVLLDEFAQDHAVYGTPFFERAVRDGAHQTGFEHHQAPELAGSKAYGAQDAHLLQRLKKNLIGAKPYINYSAGGFIQ